MSPSSCYSGNDSLTIRYRSSAIERVRMIKYLKLKNYRCFENSQIQFKDISIVVGKNNAGKSTLIEALRMVAYAADKATKTAYKEVPYGLLPVAKNYGIRIGVDKLKIDLRGIVYLYENKVAEIEAVFDDRCKIKILSNEEIAFAFLYTPDGEIIKSKAKAAEYSFDTIKILPQIGLIKENEKRLEAARVIDYRETYLSSRHFRNEVWLCKDEYWEKFKEMAEATWDDLNLVKLEYNIVTSEFIQMMVTDGHFMAEIGLMGSGLQMWLQIMWFLCRTQGAYTVILDEPDVYMHPDLQRKLVQLVKKHFKQVIIATHSIEIISEAEPSNIVMIDKKDRKMQYANSLSAVQQIIDNIGGMQNLSLIRIGLKKKCLFVEGKDMKILSKVFDKLYPEEENEIGTLPCLSLGGFMRLPEAFGAANLFYKETQNSVKCMAILDRDYYPETLLADIYDKAKENHLDLHIWGKKEIENYFIVPPMLFRLVRAKNAKENYENFLSKLDNLLEEFRNGVQDQIVEQMIRYKKGDAVSTCMASARNLMQEKWGSLDDKIAMVSGKEMISKINIWLKTEYQVSSSLDKMIKELKRGEIDEELVEILEKLC